MAFVKDVMIFEGPSGFLVDTRHSTEEEIHAVHTIVAPGRKALTVHEATVIKEGRGRVLAISIVEAGASDGAIHDCVGKCTDENKVTSIPHKIGVHPKRVVCDTGITVVPGIGQVISVMFV